MASPAVSPLSNAWKVTFTETNQAGKFLEGSLVFWRKDWIVLQSADGFPLEGMSWKNGAQISIGLVVRFPSHLVRVNACVENPVDPVVRSPSSSAISRWKATCS